MSTPSTFLKLDDSRELPRELLPTMYDLPSENQEEPGVADEFHILQANLLRDTFNSPRYQRDRVFVGSDINLYYDSRHTERYKRPDWFVSVGVPRLYKGFDLRLSYVVWDEGIIPAAMVELISPGTYQEDLDETVPQEGARQELVEGTANPKPPRKWEVYERILGIPYYVIFDRYTDGLRFFRLENDRYREQSLNVSAPQIWMPELELGIGLWPGEYDDINRLWMRWCDREGNWNPTPAETAARAKHQAECARQELERARQETEHERQNVIKSEPLG